MNQPLSWLLGFSDIVGGFEIDIVGQMFGPQSRLETSYAKASEPRREPRSVRRQSIDHDCVRDFDDDSKAGRKSHKSEGDKERAEHCFMLSRSRFAPVFNLREVAF
jgi:hypothetical protein